MTISSIVPQLAADGAQPRLTWYGPGDERVELSGAVLANWVTKAANLLLAESAAEPGTRVLLEVPVHWRALVWALATWSVGAELVLPHDDMGDGAGDGTGTEVEEDDAAGLADIDLDDSATKDDEEGEEEADAFVAHITTDEVDVAVTTVTDEIPEADVVFVIALPALAMEVSEALPLGAIDAAAELTGQADELGFVTAPEGSDPAVSGTELEEATGTGEVSHDGLEQWAQAMMPATLREQPGHRMLCTPTGLPGLLGQALATWSGGGSVVLVSEDYDAEALEQIAEAENVTARG